MVSPLDAGELADRGGPGHTAVAFTATHDQARFRSEAADGPSALVAELVTLLGASIPALYYGDEIGLTGGGGPRDFDDAWPDRALMPWADRASPPLPPRATEIREAVQGALRLRQDLDVLRSGDEEHLVPEPLDGRSARDLLVIRRSLADDVADVCVNGGAEPAAFRLPEGAPAGAIVVFAAGACTVEDDIVHLGPHAVAVVRRTIRPEDAELWERVRGEAASIARARFRAGETESAPLPSRLYLTVTERCNIRCEHCITAAPDKTARGTARSVAPWLIDALREPFAAASYIGFVHGGESLVAPIFPAVLDAIRAAKAQPKTPRAHVHLLSNGMLLTPERLEAVVSRGVTSLSVSIDGATEATNDSLRAGGKLRTIARNLERVVAARQTRGLDLRIGISTVITAGNVDEIAAVGRMALAIGVDWLKVEELFPCTTRARAEMIGAFDARVSRALGDLRAVLSGSRVVLIEHVDPPRGCGCDAAIDARTRAFREADDYANRAVFQPCRAEWEQACIDPDGTVHAVSYDSPPLGSLAHASMLDIWNGEIARKARGVALRRTRASTRRACSH